MKLDVLALAAHRDDLEITCGGTLAKLVEQGYQVGACELTQGEMGTRGSASERAAEAEEARRILGLAIRVNCEIPDAGVFNVREQQARVVAVLREFRPETVMLPGHEQRHPDHRITPQIGFDACYFAGLAKFGTGAAHRPRKILYVHTPYSREMPSFVVDISDTLERKLDALRAYRSQFLAGDASDKGRCMDANVLESVRDRARTYGMMIGKRYGEGFVQREVMEVQDVARISGSSL